jgi:hypothetical protein
MLAVSIVAPSEEEAAILSLSIPPSTTDDELIALWLHGKSPHTMRAYAEDIATYRAVSGKTLRTTYLSDLQKYADVLHGSPATRARASSKRSSPCFPSRRNWAICRLTSAPRSADPMLAINSPSGSSPKPRSPRCW